MNGPLRGRRRCVALLLLAGVLLIVGAGEAMASDCSQDITRLRACLRTFGWATAFAGLTTTVVTIMVNGADVMRTIGTRGKGTKGAMRCVFDIRTEDRRTTLEADGEDMLWIYAEVISNDPEVETDRLTRGVHFSVEGTHADWVTLGRPQMKDGMKAVRVKAEPPDGDAELVDEKVTVVAAAAIGGTTYVGPVTLTLEEEAQMKITIVE